MSTNSISNGDFKSSCKVSNHPGVIYSTINLRRSDRAQSNGRQEVDERAVTDLRCRAKGDSLEYSKT